MSTQHTAGPWSAQTAAAERDEAQLCRIVSLNSARHEIANVERRADVGQMVANARLIAAAPELLEALDDLRLCVEYHAQRNEAVPLDNEHLVKARAAIAKARP